MSKLFGLFVETEPKLQPQKKNYVPSPLINDINIEDSSELLVGVISIMDIYTKNAISDLSKSIFKVEEIKNVLPKEVPTAILKQTVIGLLPVNGLDVDSLVSDAEFRIAVIQNTLDEVTAQTDLTTANCEAEIEQLTLKIEELKGKMLKAKNSQQEQGRIASNEILKIKELVQFIQTGGK